MKKTILVFLIFLNLACLSQQITFNKVYSPYGNNPNTPFKSGSIFSFGNDYVLEAIGYDTTNNNNQSLHFYKIDSLGSFKLISRFIKLNCDYYSGISTLIKIKKGGYCYVGDIDSNYTGKLQHFIMLFDSTMNNVLTKTIPHDTIFEAINQVKQTYDNGFIIIGRRFVNNYTYDVLIIKTDSLGNQIWTKTIAFGKLCNGWQIEETPDRCLLISGYRSSSAQGDGSPFILKTDSSGNYIWSHYLGNNSQKNGGASMAITKQGDYLVAYGYSTYTYPFNEAWLARLNVIKYTSDGSQIWNRIYDTIRLDYSVNKIQVLPNNDFIIMGSNSVRDINNFFATFIFKFNSNGDSLWRKIYYYTDVFGDQNFLYDNIINPDGSITACGFVASSSMIPFQQIWILKTDSNGYAPGCYPTGIEELHSFKLGTIKAFPNPATNQTTLSYSQLTSEGNILIYNTLGQIVYEEKLAKATSQKEINIQSFKAGFYKVILREKGIIKGQVSLIKN